MDKSAYLTSIAKSIGPYNRLEIFNILKENNWDAEKIWHSLPNADDKLLEESETELRENDIKLICYNDPLYPAQLKTIHDPPPILFIKGDPTLLSQKSIAIVGTRKITEYGIRATDLFSGQLTQADLVIVSGMAYGVDAQAHRTCLSRNGKTIAVLGCGLDSNVIYPRGHQQLGADIVSAGGCLVSEYPPKMTATNFTFPLRNRIIAGIASAVLITEADIKSGSLITAKQALDNSRDVYAVPGSIFSQTSRGCNYLIANGAHPCTDPKEILERLGISEQKKSPETFDQSSFSEIEKYVLKQLLISEKSLDVDSLLVNSSFEPQDIITAVSMLELNGVIKNLNNNRFIISD